MPSITTLQEQEDFTSGLDAQIESPGSIAGTASKIESADLKGTIATHRMLGNRCWSESEKQK
jgi:hypothetical protein